LIKKDGPSGDAVANGVEFSVKNGDVETVGVRREVILSAGKPQSLSSSSYDVFSTAVFAAWLLRNPSVTSNP
jgi:hypothetical protein